MIYKDLDSSVYNYEVKNLFLQSIKRENSRNTYKFLLIQIAKYEKELDKNFYMMTQSEVRSCIDTLTKTTLKSANSMLSKLVSYLFWAISNEFLVNEKDEDNAKSVIAWLKTLKSKDIVSKVAMENQYPSKEKIYEIIDIIQNPQDGALLVLLFNGICGTELSELRYLKESDIDIDNAVIHVNGYSSIHDKSNTTYSRDVVIDKEDLQILISAMQQHSYYSIKTKESKTITKLQPLVDTEYLLKSIEKKTRKGDYIIKRSEIQKRINQISMECGKLMTPSSLVTAGQMHSISNFGKPFEDITVDDYKSILTKFNKTANDESASYLKDLYKYLKDL